jgi:hypothetical protein
MLQLRCNMLQLRCNMLQLRYNPVCAGWLASAEGLQWSVGPISAQCTSSRDLPPARSAPSPEP